MEHRINIEGTNDAEVTGALAYLAGFREGTSFDRVDNIWHKDLSSKCVICFHKKTLEKAGSFAEAVAYFGPDIITSLVYKTPKADESGNLQMSI